MDIVHTNKGISESNNKVVFFNIFYSIKNRGISFSKQDTTLHNSAKVLQFFYMGK